MPMILSTSSKTSTPNIKVMILDNKLATVVCEVILLASRSKYFRKNRVSIMPKTRASVASKMLGNNLIPSLYQVCNSV